MNIRTDIKWAELHTGLFLGGTNLGAKLDPKKRTGLIMQLDHDENVLKVWWNNEMADVERTNIAYSIPYYSEPTPKPVEEYVKDKHAAQAAVSRAKVTAQVSGPQSHVFAGPGAGKTGKN